MVLPITTVKMTLPKWIWYLISIILIFTGNVVACLIALIILMVLLYQVFTGFVTRIKFRTKKSNDINKTLAEIDQMTGPQFEVFMQKVYQKLGYSVEHTLLSGDQGADLILTTGTHRIAVQVKRYSGKVTNKAVQEVYASMNVYHCTEGAVVTNSYYTDSARQLARVNGIGLVDRDEFMRIIGEECLR